MNYVEATWHAFVAKLEELRHKVNGELHPELDALALHAAALKTEADKATVAAVAETAATVPPLLKDVAATVTEDALKAAQSDLTKSA